MKWVFGVLMLLTLTDTWMLYRESVQDGRLHCTVSNPFTEHCRGKCIE